MGGAHQELVSWAIDWKQNGLPRQLEEPGKWHSKTQGTTGGKIPENTMQTGWEDAGELKWKWSIPYWQDKSQTKGYLPIRITVLIQKPVVGCGHAFGGLQYKTMKGVMLTIKWSPLIITRYLTAEDAPQMSPSQLCLFLLIVEKKWLKIREANTFCWSKYK